MAPRPTLAKVAHLAGVSKTTAANVLHGRGKTTEETRQRVIAAAESINYRLNAAASGLSRGRSDVVGVLVSDYVPGFVMSGLSAVFVQRCSQEGLVVSFASEDQVQRLIDSGIDILVVVGQPAHMEDIRLPFGLPVVSLETIAGQPAWASHDPAAIAAVVVEHVVSQGGTTLGWLLGPGLDEMFGPWTDALGAAAAHAGIGFANRRHDLTRESVTQALEELLASDVDSILCAMSWSPDIVECLSELGKSTPEDVLLIVQSEGTVESAMTPKVSTLSLMTIESGNLIAQMCIDTIAGSKPEKLELPFRLEPRASSQRR